MTRTTTVPKPVVVVTGATSGIGLAAATLLQQRGFAVIGGGRRVKEPHTDVAGIGWHPLDVRDEASCKAFFAWCKTQAPRIDAVVHCAGYALGGAVEDGDMAQIRDQFDTNFLGAVMVARAVLPTLREQRSGTLLFVSSLVGLIAAPFHGYYSASKFAIEGLAEALRYEVKPFGVYVSLLEPGDFQTGMTQARIVLAPKLPAYDGLRERAVDEMGKNEQKGPPSSVAAEKIEKILRDKRPALRYRVGADSVWFPRLRGWIPASLFEWGVAKAFKL